MQQQDGRPGGEPVVAPCHHAARDHVGSRSMLTQPSGGPPRQGDAVGRQKRDIGRAGRLDPEVTDRPRIEGLGPVDEAEFIALTLGDIHAAAKLAPLLKLLDDQRTVASGTPSGATPQRRICDLAVDSLVSRFSLQLSFPLRPADRYTGAEIEQVRELATSAVAKG